jgi:hypothetical protein
MTTSDLAATAARGRFRAHPSFSGRNRAGLIITFIIGLTNVPSILAPSGDNADGSSDGPPFAINLLDSILGVVMVVVCWLAWRNGNRAFVRIAAGTAILAALTAVPAFFVDVSSAIKVLVGVAVVVTFVAVVLMLSPERRNPTVVD